MMPVELIRISVLAAKEASAAKKCQYVAVLKS